MKKWTVAFLFSFSVFFMIAPGTLMACGLPDGCTPGYWKQMQHSGNWPTALQLCGDEFGDGVAENCSFQTVFGVIPTTTNLTLKEALNKEGGGEYALGRHAVAALLNAHMALLDSSFDYCWTPIEVIEAVQDAYASGTKSDFNLLKGSFEYDNEKYCPLN